MRSSRYYVTAIGVLLACGLGFAFAGQQRRRPNRPARRASKAALPPPELPNPYSNAIRQNNVGMALMGRHEFAQALGRFQIACIMNSQSDTGCLNMGIALFHMRQYKDARAVLLKSTQQDPKNVAAWFNLALLEQAEGHDGTALQAFEKAAALDPHDAGTQYMIASLYAKRMQYDKAAAAYERAIKADPLLISAEYGLAQADAQTGDTEGALAHLNRAEQLTSEHRGKMAGSNYGEQGRYSRAQEMQVPSDPAPPPIRIRFVNVTAFSGLPRRAALSSRDRARARSRNRRKGAPETAPRPAAQPAAKFLGSGACVFDYNGDGRPDIFLADADGDGHPALYRNVGRGRFVNATKAAKLDLRGEVLGCAVGDYDSDGRPDLAVSLANGIALFRNLGNGTFENVTAAAGIRAAGMHLGLTFISEGNDGSVGLYATRFRNFRLQHPDQPFEFPAQAETTGNVLWRRSSRGRFVNETDAAGLMNLAPSVGALGVDLGGNGALDLVVTGWRKTPEVFYNTQEGTFREKNPFGPGMPGPTAGVVALDFEHDGRLDLAFTHWVPPGLSLWRNVDGKSFVREPLPSPGWMRGWGVAPVDYDNDGWVDLVAVGDTFAGEGRIVLLRNEGGDGNGGFLGFRDVTHEVGLDKIVLHNPRAVIPFDATGDGSVYLLITQNGRPPVLLKAVGRNNNNWLNLGFIGRSGNRLGLGTSVQILSGARRQTWEASAASGYLGQGPLGIVAGLGIDAEADVLRIRWPGGPSQDEIQIAGDKRVVITEGKPQNPSH